MIISIFISKYLNMKTLLILALLFVACNKDNSTPSDLNYGCVYGVSKATHERIYIRCEPQQIYVAGYNQTAANTIAAKYGIPSYNVTIMSNFSDWEFIPNKKCDCE